jgi:hypothetical protein
MQGDDSECGRDSVRSVLGPGPLFGHHLLHAAPWSCFAQSCAMESLSPRRMFHLTRRKKALRGGSKKILTRQPPFARQSWNIG